MNHYIRNIIVFIFLLVNQNSFSAIATIPSSSSDWLFANPKPHGGTSYYSIATKTASSTVVAVGKGGPVEIVVSQDNGDTWSTATPANASDFPLSAVHIHMALNHVIWDGSQFIAVGGSNSSTTNSAIFTSPTGITWTKQTSGSKVQLNKIAYNNSTLVTVGNNASITPTGTNGDVLYSTNNGVTWNKVSITLSSQSTAGKYSYVASNGTTSFLLVTDAGLTLKSTDGITWTETTTGVAYIKNLFWDGSQFVATDNSGNLHTYSTANDTWTANVLTAKYSAVYGLFTNEIVEVIQGGIVSTSTANSVASLAQKAANIGIAPLAVGKAGSNYILAGYNGIFTSTNLITWANKTGPTESLNNIAWSGSLYVAVGNSTTATSTNGTDWAFNNSNGFENIAWAPNANVFVAVDGSKVATSNDGINWAKQTLPVGLNSKLHGIYSDGTTIVVVGGKQRGYSQSNGLTEIFTSTDGGTTWNKVTLSFYDELWDITKSNDTWVAVGGTYNSNTSNPNYYTRNTFILSSKDLVTWTSHPVHEAIEVLYNIIWDGVQFTATGAYKIKMTSLDGINWAFDINAAKDSNNIEWDIRSDLVWTGSHYVGVNGKNIVTSTDGKLWSQHTHGSTINGLLWDGSKLYAVGDKGSISYYGTANGKLDFRPPTIIAPNNKVIETTNSTALTNSESSITSYIAQASATDDTDNSPTVNSSNPAYPIGTTEVSFSATDADGNKSATTTSLLTVARAFPDAGWQDTHKVNDTNVESTVVGFADLEDVTWNGWRFVAVGNGKGGASATSTDGVLWTFSKIDKSSSSSLYFNTVLWDGAQFIAFSKSYNKASYKSTDGIVWSPATNWTMGSLNDAVWTGSKLIVVGLKQVSSYFKANIWVADSINATPTKVYDGITDDLINNSATSGVDTLNAIAYNGSNLFIAVGDNGGIVSSADGSSWARQTSGEIYNLNSIFWDGSQFVATGDTFNILTSTNGITWTKKGNLFSGTKEVITIDSNYYGISYNGTYSTNLLYKTTDLTVDAVTPTTNNTNLGDLGFIAKAIHWSGKALVAVGHDGKIKYMGIPGGDTVSITAPVSTDTTKPTLNVPSNITVTASTASGNSKTTDTAIIAFLAGATATDNVDTSLTITNNAPNFLPAGQTTTVTFSVTDSSNNTTTGTATITVGVYSSSSSTGNTSTGSTTTSTTSSSGGSIGYGFLIGLIILMCFARKKHSIEYFN